MASQPPVTLAEFKAQFDRDFVYGVGLDTVRDSDITRAFNDAVPLFNGALFDTSTGKLAFLHSAAHFLVTNIQAVGGLSVHKFGLGIENQADQVMSSKGVGGVSLSFVEPPPTVKNNPNLLQFWNTTYGQRYLSFLLPKLVGSFSVVEGPLSPDTVGPDIPFAGP